MSPAELQPVGFSEGNHSKVLRFLEGFSWEGVPVAPYKKTTDAYRDVTRRVLVGETGESPRFHLRYFEVGPGGHTTLEQHEHEHVVVAVRGRGEVQVDCRVYRVGFGDVVYVAPDDAHQFRNPEGEEPFGFLCIVNAERDCPRPTDGPARCEICE